MAEERNVPYIFAMMMEDGTLIKMISIGATSMEAIDGMNILVVRLLNPKILGRAPEEFDATDMEPLEGNGGREDEESRNGENPSPPELDEKEELEDSTIEEMC